MKNSWILSGLLIAVCGCATARHGEADLSAQGPANTRVAELGPYRVQVGLDGTNEVLLITRGAEKLYSKVDNKVSVYIDGRSLFDYASSGPNHILAAYMIHIRDVNGAVAFTLTDENADGVFDRKIDYGTQAVYEWKGNQWVGGKK